MIYTIARAEKKYNIIVKTKRLSLPCAYTELACHHNSVNEENIFAQIKFYICHVHCAHILCATIII